MATDGKNEPIDLRPSRDCNPPGYDSVRNVPASGRQILERSREFVEKKRLKERDFGFQRYKGEAIDAPFDIDTTSSGFMSAADRFHCDTVGEIKARRDADRARANAKYQCKREKALEIERRLQARAEHKSPRRGGQYSQRIQVNKNSVAYNPVTLKYSDNEDGQMLKQQHAQVLYRVALRSKNLQEKSNGGFNPITGEPTRPIQIPAAQDLV